MKTGAAGVPVAPPTARETTMPKVKVPQRLRELADELALDLEDQTEFTSDPQELIAWMKNENEDKRAEENQHRDDIGWELDELEIEMTEDADNE
jgi:hypothetical protein